MSQVSVPSYGPSWVMVEGVSYKRARVTLTSDIPSDAWHATIARLDGLGDGGTQVDDWRLMSLLLHMHLSLLGDA